MNKSSKWGATLYPISVNTTVNNIDITNVVNVPALTAKSIDDIFWIIDPDIEIALNLATKPTKNPNAILKCRTVFYFQIYNFYIYLLQQKS